MVGFADIHNHLLPGVDDGSRSMEETLRHLERFAAEGVVELAMTPHLARPATWDRGGLAGRISAIERAFESVLIACAGRDDLRLHLGQEIFAPDSAHLEAILSYDALGIGETGFILVEFGFEPLKRPEAVIDLATSRGYRVIVAHPERYLYDSPAACVAAARGWVEKGAFLQVNLGSLSGFYEEWTEGSGAMGWRLLDEGLAHLLASDDHGDGRSQLDQRKVMGLIRERGGIRQAEILLGENPLRLLRGQSPQAVEPLLQDPPSSGPADPSVGGPSE
ncbi:tyrosine-protein phosphatase [soil metagenome]